MTDIRKIFLLVLILGIALAVVIPVVNRITDDPPEGDAEAWIRAWTGVGLEARAVTEMHKLVEAEPENISYNYRWIMGRLWLQEHDRQGKLSGDSIERYYTKLAGDDTKALADIGYYGLGLIDSAGHDSLDSALKNFNAVRNRELPFLNNSIGFCLMQLGRNEEALPHFEREIQLDGNVGGASRNLAEALLKLDRADQLAARCEQDPDFQSRLPVSLLRRLAIGRRDVVGYLKLAVTGRFSAVHSDSFIAALVILGIWILFLWRLDLFEPERPLHIGFTLFLGMATLAGPATLLYDLFELASGLELGSSVTGDFLFCILGVGVIEESLKLIPLLIIMRFTDWVDEPVDVVIYGATSALGFAFMENLRYFGPMGLSGIHGRAFSATVFHMALTAIASYGLLKAQTEGRTLKIGVVSTLPYFGAAVLTHGLYDFFLITRGPLAALSPLALLILVFAVSALRSIVINGLSWSPFWSDDLNHRLLRRWWYLALSLSSVVFMEFILLALRFGPTAASAGFLKAALGSFFLVLVLLGLFGAIPVVRHQWLPLVERKARKKSSASSS